MKRLAVWLGVILVLAFTGVAHAAPKSVAVIFSLQSETDGRQAHPWMPDWCMHEDSYHDRLWSGSLTGSFATTEYFCDNDVDIFGGVGFDGGGTGLYVDATVVGPLDHLTLTTPGYLDYYGPWSVSAVLMDSYTTGKGHNLVRHDHYRACVFPGGEGAPAWPFSGTWTVTLAGSFSDASLRVTGEMQGSAAGGWPSGPCPAGQQP